MEYVAPDCELEQGCGGVLGFYTASQSREKKERTCSSNLQRRGTDPPAGWLPYFSSLGRASRKEAKVQGLAQAAAAPVSSLQM